MSLTDDPPARSEPGLPVRLSRRPSATTFAVEDLVQAVQAGQVRVPVWQRGLKWELDDVRQLFDSVHRGYPIGTLLFWRKPAPAESLRYGSVVVLAGERGDALYVVDGQQRIHAFVRTLLGDGPPAEDFSLCFDLDRGEFRAPLPRRAPPPTWVPLNRVVDSSALLTWLFDHPELSAAQRSAAIELGKRVREYQVPAYVVDAEDERVVRDIFQRTNNTGKALRADEIFDALHRREDQQPHGVRDVAVRLSALGVGRVEEATVHTMMRALFSTDVTRDTTGTWDREQALDALRRTTVAAERAIDFLVNQAGFHRLELLPYTLPLITLTRFFDRHPAPHPRNRLLLSRWLWRGSATGVLTGATVRTRETLEAITDAEDTSVQGLLKTVGGPDPEFDPQAEEFNFRHARSKLLVLALWSLEPRDLATGSVLPHDQRPLPPRVLVSKVACGSSVGNRILHPARKRSLVAQLRQTDRAEVLESHGVDDAARAALVAGDLEAFVRQRERRIAGEATALVARQCAWAQSDRPPLRLLADEGDDE